jgi:hypothetical protein
MLLGSLLFIALAAFFLAGVWLVLYTPSCRTCKVRLEGMGETIRPWGRLGVDAVFYYICPQCAWMTRRRHMITHLD